jgi:hypothetical protein
MATVCDFPYWNNRFKVAQNESRETGNRFSLEDLYASSICLPFKELVLKISDKFLKISIHSPDLEFVGFAKVLHGTRKPSRSGKLTLEGSLKHSDLVGSIHVKHFYLFCGCLFSGQIGSEEGHWACLCHEDIAKA